MFADNRTYPKIAVSRVSELVDKADSQGLDVVAGDLQEPCPSKKCRSLTGYSLCKECKSYNQDE